MDRQIGQRARLPVFHGLIESADRFIVGRIPRRPPLVELDRALVLVAGGDVDRALEKRLPGIFVVGRPRCFPFSGRSPPIAGHADRSPTPAFANADNRRR